MDLPSVLETITSWLDPNRLYSFLAGELSDATVVGLQSIDDTFTAFFLVEIIFRMIAFGPRRPDMRDFYHRRWG